MAIAGLVGIRDVKDYVDLATSGAEDTTFDAWLTDAVAMVSQEVVEFCNQPLAQGSRTVIFDGNGAAWKTLPHFPVTSITSLSTRGSITTAWAAVATTDYELDTTPESGAAFRVYAPGGYTVGARNYKIIYVSGYAEIPDDVRRVVVEKVALLWKDSMRAGGESRLGVTNISHSTGGGSVSKGIAHPIARWNDVLDNYRVRLA